MKTAVLLNIENITIEDRDDHHLELVFDALPIEGIEGIFDALKTVNAPKELKRRLEQRIDELVTEQISMYNLESIIVPWHPNSRS